MSWSRALLAAGLSCGVVQASAQSRQPQPSPSPKAQPAQQVCPWLTAGTAAAVLGGTPAAQISIASPVEGTCTFTVTQGQHQSVLAIMVGSQRPTLCRPGSTSYAGIGDEATMCQARPSGSALRTTFESRVRNVYFTVNLTQDATPRGNAGDQQQKQQETLERVAEQVAGNLF